MECLCYQQYWKLQQMVRSTSTISTTVHRLHWYWLNGLPFWLSDIHICMYNNNIYHESEFNSFMLFILNWNGWMNRTLRLRLCVHSMSDVCIYAVYRTAHHRITITCTQIESFLQLVKLHRLQHSNICTLALVGRVSEWVYWQRVCIV